MIIGILSDTHLDKAGAIPHIIQQFKKREVELIIHCGDIEPQHVSKELFGNYPVICALVKGQKEDALYGENSPDGWRFTRTEDRIRRLPTQTLIYVGHKRHTDFIMKTESEFNFMLAELRNKYDGLRYVFGGHLHFQTFKQGHLVNFINPGAVEGALSQTYEYAIVDTETQQVIFGRILPTKDDREIFSIGVISDSLDITHRDNHYWSQLASEFHARDVSHIIHCGNIVLTDIGRPELKDFFVYFAIRGNQKDDYKKLLKAGKIPDNWKVVTDQDPDDGAVVEINGYHLFVRLDLGFQFLEKSEYNMDRMALEIRRKFPETEYVLCGFTREALLVEGEQVTTINPGDVNTDRSFVVICLPRREITFGRVRHEPLPKITSILPETNDIEKG